LTSVYIYLLSIIISYTNLDILSVEIYEDMKKRISLLSIVFLALSLMAFSYLNKKNSTPDVDLLYKVESRFTTTVTQEQLANAISIVDILPVKETSSIVSYQDVSLSIVDDNAKHTHETPGDNDLLTHAQKILLSSVENTDNIHIKADIKRDLFAFDPLRVDLLTYFISVIPAVEARYEGGEEELIAYLRKSTKEEASIIRREKLQPGKVSFIITPTGAIEDVRLTSTCGYSNVDKTLEAAITNMPAKWTPAQNAQGESVAQKFTFFFGLMGC